MAELGVFIGGFSIEFRCQLKTEKERLYNALFLPNN